MVYIEAQETTRSDEYWAMFFVVLMIFSLFLSRVLDENLTYYQLKVGTQAKQGISSMIYSKVLKLSPATNKSFNKGDVISFLQIDANKVTFVFDTFLDIVKIPMKILFVIIVLYIFIGVVFLAAIGLIIIFGFINYVIAIMTKKVQRLRMKRASERIHKISEVVDNIKLIKFNSWVDKYIQIINKVRNKELVMKVRKEMLGAINDTIKNLNYPLLAISIFLIAILGAKMSVTVPAALTILQFLNSLNNSSKNLPTFIGDFTEFIISMERVQDFLQCEELDFKRIKYDSSDENAISIKDGYFYWGFQDPSSSKDKKNKKAKKRSKF